MSLVTSASPCAGVLTLTVMSGCASFHIWTTFLMLGAHDQNESVTGLSLLALFCEEDEALSSPEPPPQPPSNASESSSTAARRAVDPITLSSPDDQSVTAHRLGTGLQGCQVRTHLPTGPTVASVTAPRRRDTVTSSFTLRTATPLWP